MGSNQNTIVLNGKLYDAVTGKLIHQQAPARPVGPKPAVHKKTGRTIDGVVAHPVKKPKTKIKHPADHHEARRHTPVRAHGHKPQRAATLMRHAVTKPAHQPKAAKQAKPETIHDARTADRLARAQAVQKSHHIQRFPHHRPNHDTRPTVAKKQADVKVEKVPEHKPAAHHEARHPATHTVPLSASEKLVHNALKNARAHEAHPKKRRRLSHALGFQHRSSRVAAGALAVLILVGFFVYQNVPNLSMRLAANQAGFDAQLPGYAPSGFAQDKLVSYSPGKVTISFHSNTDARQFKLTQQVSNWNSQAVADNFLAKDGKQFQTYQANGKTIYIYDTSNATWVNGGVWYQIEGESSLNSDQILKIANSI